MNMRDPVAMLKLWEHAKRDESLLENHFRNRVPEDLAELYADHIDTITAFAGDTEFADVNARIKTEAAELKEAAAWYEDRRLNPSHHAEPPLGGDSVDGIVGRQNSER